MADIGKDLERLARALAVSFGDNPDEPTASLLNEGEVRWHEYVGHVRAVLEELKKLSPDMLGVSEPDTIWTDSLDSILSQDKEG